MIDRGYQAAALNALKQPDAALLAFVDIDWPGGAVRVHSGLGERPFAGLIFQGVGDFGGIKNVSERGGNSPNQLTLTLNVMDAGAVGRIMNDSPEGREVHVHMAVLDDNRKIAHEVPFVYDGEVAKCRIKRGNLAKEIPYVISLVCSDWFERWNQAPDLSRTTNEAQQFLYPGDRFFDQTEILASSPLSNLPVRRPRNPNPRRGGYEP